jgi:hypothetical protein
MHPAGLKKRWKYQVTTRMTRAHREGQWRFPKSKDFLKQYPCFATMRNQLWSLTWWAYIGAWLVDPRFSIQYMGRYTKRAVMAEYRIVYYDGKIVGFSDKDYAHGAKSSSMTMKVYTVIASFFGNWQTLPYLFDTAGKDADIAPPLRKPGE